MRKNQPFADGLNTKTGVHHIVQPFHCEYSGPDLMWMSVSELLQRQKPLNKVPSLESLIFVSCLLS